MSLLGSSLKCHLSLHNSSNQHEHSLPSLFARIEDMDVVVTNGVDHDLVLSYETKNGKSLMLEFLAFIGAHEFRSAEVKFNFVIQHTI